MATYRYVFADLLTDQDIAALELEDVRFDRRIIQPGSFSARIPVPNERVARLVRRVIPTRPDEIHTGVGRVVVHVYRDLDLWGTYLIWSAIPQGDERGGVSVEIQGASLESYLHHVEIRDDLTFSARPQELIASDLIEHLQSDPHADIGLTIGTGDHEAQPRDRTYRRSEAATYGQRLTELASVDGGFEWMIRCYHVGQERRREFVTAEMLGGGQDHMFSRPGSIIRWRYLIDATDAATSWQARGDTVNTELQQDSEPLMSAVYEADGLLGAGWPRLDQTIDRPSVILTSTLEEYARWYRDHRSGVVRIPEITVRLDDRTRFSPNALGDWARITIVDPWHPLRDDGTPSYAPRLRIVGVEIIPTSRETGQEECRLIAAADEEV